MPTPNNTTMDRKKVTTDKSLVKLNHKKSDTSVPAIIEIPPKVGVGEVCSFLALGRSNSLNLFTIAITGGIKINVNTKAVTKQSKANLKSLKLRSTCSR